MSEVMLHSPEYLAESAASTIRGTVWTATSVALLTVILRCYTRLWLRRVFGTDDVLIVISVVILLAYAIIIETAVSNGLGRHIEFVLLNPKKALLVGLLGQISQPLVIMSCAVGKTSFAITLMRVAAQRWIHVTLWFIIWSMNILHVMVSVFVFARCEDPRTTWDPSVVSECWSHERYLTITLFIGSYSAATDFALALLPWAMLWRLNMKKREKGGVAVAMSLGIFAGIVAIVKAAHLAGSSSDPDITWSVAPLLWWAGTENGLIIIAACVPTLRPLLRKLMPFSSLKSSNNDHPLRNMQHSLNMFTPKSKQGQWSAIVETDIGGSTGGVARDAMSYQGGQHDHESRGEDRCALSMGITKRTEVEVSYGEPV
ncbi:hypothetical protein CC79DRAFT_1393048 [Sarocladium strictum]